MHRIRRGAALALAAVLASAALTPGVRAQGCPVDWTFTYQGQLKNAGVPQNGTANLTFAMFDTAVGGTQVGATIVQNNVPLTDGTFTVNLDFTQGGVVPGIFDGCKRYLEITVNGTPLSPRQYITTATPHAAVADLLHMPYAETTVVDGTPAFLLTNLGTGAGMQITSTSADSGAVAIYAEVTDATHNLNNAAIEGVSHSTEGAGVLGTNFAQSGYGVFGSVTGAGGYGVAGLYGNLTGTGSAIEGTCLSPNGWAGYFAGRGTFEKEVGIGIQNAAAQLDVQGSKSGMAFRVNDDLYATSGGFVGVGRSTPITSAEVFGVSSSTNIQNSYGGMYVETAGLTSRPFYGYATGGTTKAWTYFDGTTATWRLNLSNTDQLTLDPLHGLGVGRAAASNKLEVEGNASKTTAGSWLANSDRRIKSDIRTVSNALETLDRVRLVDFVYTPEYRAAHPGLDGRRYHNVIAQEFREVFPDYVKSSGEKLPNGDEILQVDTYPLTIYSAAAVQELHAQLKAKDAEIAALRAQVAQATGGMASLTARLAAMETAVAAMAQQQAPSVRAASATLVTAAQGE